MRHLRSADANADFVDEQNCRFGLRLREEGVPRYAPYAEFAAVVPNHHRLHAAALKVARPRKAGLPVTQTDLDALQRESSELTDELRRLQTTILSKLANSEGSDG